jgi:1-acyl-sn-glycerol-3-phosphate acyltransferase
MNEHILTLNTARTWKQRFAIRVLTLFKWRVRLAPFPGPRGVIIVYPHTSNWDFPIGMLARWAAGIEMRWLGKETLFRGITGKLLGPLLRSWGGEPVERRSATGAIDRLAQRFHQADWYWLAFSPEGTRRFRPQWRSGFYHITLAAKVPLALAYIDYATKEVGAIDFIELTGDVETDLAMIRAAYAGRQGRYPELAAPIDWTR